MSDKHKEALSAFRSQKSYRGSDELAFCHGYMTASKKLEAENAALKAKLEEERQENASLRS